MSNLNSKDYYDILGVRRGSDENALKKAYKKLAVKVSERNIAGNLWVLILSPAVPSRFAW
jgi:preprotein translocase subunit Sec63